ncbi:hypothetical protein PSHT_00418 [Puccinia striiformis]|uniref:Uncharacterized protein n=3 Tax=Puccinia striiformis TaxID=27350 RepID=A0A0L0UWA6_9BASI|nr:hypothetical protein H4Q26_003273 [Puccinia striiformis f. sp. tritici PST-130]KNE91221.1 hypothetical protein PSTG_15349 [Puccinia striiformis f. sp. tritici PST-78]POV96043.1 hypothetical protein PSTT_15883 [Puccinia striiformis]POW23171.1 hypothetical protein PSHT_00418 [Puccinia striiformis]
MADYDCVILAACFRNTTLQSIVNEQPNLSERLSPTAVINQQGRQVDQAEALTPQTRLQARESADPQRPAWGVEAARSINFQKRHPGINIFGAYMKTSQPARPSYQPFKDSVSDKIDVPQSS